MELRAVAGWTFCFRVFCNFPIVWPCQWCPKRHSSEVGVDVGHKQSRRRQVAHVYLVYIAKTYATLGLQMRSAIAVNFKRECMRYSFTLDEGFNTGCTKHSAISSCIIFVASLLLLLLLLFIIIINNNSSRLFNLLITFQVIVLYRNYNIKYYWEHGY